MEGVNLNEIIIELQGECDRLKAENARLGLLVEVREDEIKQFAEECDRLRAENARLVAQVKNLLLEQGHAEFMRAELMRGGGEVARIAGEVAISWKALRDLLAPTVELLDILGNIELDHRYLDQIKAELARLISLSQPAAS